MSRGEDMCFAITTCNTFLLTASSSTYGWWIALLGLLQIDKSQPIIAKKALTKLEYFQIIIEGK
uniref:Uncharacterized protein n=1 Tax=Meloidogyne hapla TaxID=6305 RepID=A0A1I8B640_MELHA